MNPQQGSQQGAQQGAQQPPLIIPPVRQGYGGRPAHRSPPPPVRKRAAAYMAPAPAAPACGRTRSPLPPPAAKAPAPAAQAPAAQPRRTPGCATFMSRARHWRWHNGKYGRVALDGARRPRRRRRPRLSPEPEPEPEPGAPPRSPNNNRVAPKKSRPGGPADAGAGAERRRDPGCVPARASGAAAGKPVVPPAPPSPVAWPAPSPPRGRDGVRPSLTLTADPPTGVT